MISPLEIRFSLFISALFGLQKLDMTVQSYHFVDKEIMNVIQNHSNKRWNDFIKYLNETTKGDDVKLNEEIKVSDVMKEYYSLSSKSSVIENLNEEISSQNSKGSGCNPQIDLLIKDNNIKQKEELGKIFDSLMFEESDLETENEQIIIDEDSFDTRSEYDKKIRNGGLCDIESDIRLHPNYEIKKHEILSPEFKGKRKYHTSVRCLKNSI
jgi:hypothetical protein